MVKAPSPGAGGWPQPQLNTINPKTQKRHTHIYTDMQIAETMLPYAATSQLTHAEDTRSPIWMCAA